MGVSMPAWMAVVSRPRIGCVRMPRILVSRDAVLCDLGPGMGERAKGAEVTASSERV